MMPLRVAQQPTLPNGATFPFQTKAADARADEPVPSTDGRVRKRLNSTVDAASRRTNSVSSRLPDQKPNFPARRPSVRDHKGTGPLGPRPPEYTASKPFVTLGPIFSSLTNHLSRDSARSNLSARSFPLPPKHNTSQQKERGLPEIESFEFEPLINFDQLQTNLSSDDLQLAQFPAPGVGGRILSSQPSTAPSSINKPVDESAALQPTVSAGGPRFGKSGSLLRRQSIASRQASQTASPAAMDAATAVLPNRSRRQSHFPAQSSNLASAKPPRKSIGPGVTDADFAARAAQRRRPSLASTNSTAVESDRDSARPGNTRVSVSGSAVNERSGLLTTSRNFKAKSMQPVVRQSRDSSLLNASNATPDQTRASISQARSPGKSPGRRTNTPSSAGSKRQSVLPAHAVSGLGARTISPTDARRLKRLSTLQNPPPMPSTPPTPQPELSGSRSLTHSPSMIPRKSVTPSSSRTTPDLNRKSFNSTLSTSSSASLNSSRNSTASTLQPRIPQSLSTSRLPTPKTRNVHSSAGPEDGEEVPPVPAIPKAYESPKEAGDLSFPVGGKINFPFDTSNPLSTTVGEPDYSSFRRREPLSVDPDTRYRRGLTIATSSDAEKKSKVANSSSTRNLQPLRLPPFNILPLSTPTVSKVAALQVHPQAYDGTKTPPPKRGNGKPPVTPMTASRATFFSKDQEPDNLDQVHRARSSSTSQGFQPEFGMQRAPSSSSSIMPPPAYTDRHLPSPYISSTTSKSSTELPDMRPNTSGDFISSSMSLDPRTGRVNGPRAQTSSRSMKEDPTAKWPSPETDAPNSGSSIRRKLSISWKRSSSKAGNEREAGASSQPPKYEEMPPPKLPASATWNSGLNKSPSPMAKATSHFSRRRKSSASSLNALAASQKNELPDLDGSARSVRKQSTDSVRTTPTTSRSASILGPVHKMLGSKSSSGAMKFRVHNDSSLDPSDQAAEDEMRRLASKRKDFEAAAREVDELRARATPKERVAPSQAVRMVNLNIFERGEIVDYKDVYFCGTRDAKKHVGDLNATSANFGYDDERGDYNIVSGDHLAYRYEIVDVLGKGSFGQVVRCVDHKTGGLVAVKIIRNKKRFHQQALVEVNILRKLREWDPQNKHSMVNFTQNFYFRGHLCISTELLGMNLYEFIKSNDFRGFSLKLIRRFTKQLLSSLILLKGHKVIHCDLKPENILLAHPVRSEIKVIDFGSSCFENEKVYTYIQSRFYRSPEVILGMTYGMPIDMWSLGCILAELYTGFPIFPGENEQEQLACIMEVFGPPEKHLIEKSTRKKLFFDSLGKPRLTVSSKGRRRRPSSKTLQQALKCDDDAFVDFIARCLRWDPERRIKPDEAFAHEFITGLKKPARGRAGFGASATAAVITTEPSTKRSTPATTPSAIRPLPEPPATAFRNGVPVKTREAQNVSPSKSGSVKRLSIAMAGVHSITGGAKRTSTVPTLPNGSALPRVAGRGVVSGTGPTGSRSDLATAAAAASLVS
ncbi:MAG: hypothetical protein M1814_002239 [Vezdaea aestivalis]|nr:MAG: hypothetical protein M1814_002239 [Vezdaea aestivalis]